MKVFVLVLTAILGHVSCDLEWNDYHLVDSDEIDRAAIVRMDGSILAKSDDFKGTDQELRNLLEQMKNPLNVELVKIEGLNYTVIHKSADELQAKHGGDGLIAKNARTVVVVGFYGEVIQSKGANEFINRVVEFLMAIGH